MIETQSAQVVLRRFKIFLCYSGVDKEKSREIHNKLTSLGYDVWRDEEQLVAGQNWDTEIRKAIENADIVIICLSQNSTSREGYIQKEIKYARDVALEKPEGTIYLIPALIEECQVPHGLSNYQWVNLLNDKGWDLLLTSIKVREKQLSGMLFDSTGTDRNIDNMSKASIRNPKSAHLSNEGELKENRGLMWKIGQFFKPSSSTTELLMNNVSEIVKNILSPNASDIEKIAASQIKLLTNYYLLVLEQARRSFLWALIWATVGVIGFITAGIFLFLNQSQNIALIGTIGGALVEIISGINFYLYNKSSAQLAEFHTRLDATQKLLLSNAVADKVEGELKQVTRSYIALKFAGIDVKPDVIEESFDLTPKVGITHIELNPAGSDIVKEFATIANSGKVVADLTNWSLSDEAGHTFKFPLFFLKPGSSVNVWTRNGKNIPTDLFWKMKRGIWNNNADVAYLRDGNGSLVDSFRYSVNNKSK